MSHTKCTLFTLCVLSLALSACNGKQSANHLQTPKQEITINNAAEPSSLDPHKAGGVPESNAIVTNPLFGSYYVISSLILGGIILVILLGPDPDKLAW